MEEEFANKTDKKNSNEGTVDNTQEKTEMILSSTQEKNTEMKTETPVKLMENLLSHLNQAANSWNNYSVGLRTLVVEANVASDQVFTTLRKIIVSDTLWYLETMIPKYSALFESIHNACDILSICENIDDFIENRDLCCEDWEKIQQPLQEWFDLHKKTLEDTHVDFLTIEQSLAHFSAAETQERAKLASLELQLKIHKDPTTSSKKSTWFWMCFGQNVSSTTVTPRNDLIEDLTIQQTRLLRNIKALVNAQKEITQTLIPAVSQYLEVTQNIEKSLQDIIQIFSQCSSDNDAKKIPLHTFSDLVNNLESCKSHCLSLKTCLFNSQSEIRAIKTFVDEEYWTPTLHHNKYIK